MPRSARCTSQIKLLIVQDLQAGEWKPGEAIPSEIELAARFGVSQGTVRKAIDDLAAENLLMRRQGKGTFVATHAEQHHALPLSAPGRRRRQRPRPAAPAARLPPCARRRRHRAPAGLKSGDAVVLVRRLLLAEQRPVVLDDIWLPGTPVQGLDCRAAGSLRGPDVRAVRSGVRRAHDPRRGEDPRRGRRQRGRGAARGGRWLAAAERGAPAR